MFKQPIDTSKIEKIKIGNLEIPITRDGSWSSRTRPPENSA
jgi:hypothetical protein